jgi:hypothetical protein
VFQLTSRYYGLETSELETVEGKVIRYIRRRFVPQPDRFELLIEHTVAEGDRLDTIAAQYVGDSEQFWRICDANNAIRPDELIETLGRRLRVTLPEGLAMTHAS